MELNRNIFVRLYFTTFDVNYAYEPESKQSTVWVFQDEPNPTKADRARSSSKQMIACFFGKTRHVAIVVLE